MADFKSASSQKQQPSGRQVAEAGKPMSPAPNSRSDGRGTLAPSREMSGSRGAGGLSDTGAMHRLFDEGVDSGGKGKSVRGALGATKKNPSGAMNDHVRSQGIGSTVSGLAKGGTTGRELADRIKGMR